MINSTQVATVMIGVMLGAGVFYGGFDRAVAVPSEAGGAMPKMSPAAAAIGGSSKTPATFAEEAAPVAPPPAAQPPGTEEDGRASLFRGALGPIFSRGIDRLTERIEQAGVRASVNEFTICRVIAAMAIREYRQDPAPIILIR